MVKHPHTDLHDVPALHWHYVYSDLLAISSAVPADEAYDHEATITAYVECFKREDGYYHWEILKNADLVEHGWMDTLRESQNDAETNFDRLRNA